MARTSEGDQLTADHRLAQAQIGNSVAARMVAVSGLLRVGDLDERFPQWLAVVAPIITDAHEASAIVTTAYLRKFRQAEGVSAAGLLRADPLPVERIESTMTAQMVAKARKSLALYPPEEALQRGITESARSGSRLAMEGGRATTEANRNERIVIGYARATSGNPCAFCAMLASRGPVYLSADNADRAQQGRRAGRKYHDGCHCQHEEIYIDADGYRPPGEADKYAAQWREATRRAREEDVRPDVMFRRIHENRTNPKENQTP